MNFLCCHLIGALRNQVHTMGIQNSDRRSPTASRHRRGWKNVIATETKFSVDLPVNRLFVAVAEETATH